MLRVHQHNELAQEQERKHPAKEDGGIGQSLARQSAGHPGVDEKERSLGGDASGQVCGDCQLLAGNCFPVTNPSRQQTPFPSVERQYGAAPRLTPHPGTDQANDPDNDQNDPQHAQDHGESDENCRRLSSGQTRQSDAGRCAHAESNERKNQHDQEEGHPTPTRSAPSGLGPDRGIALNNAGGV
jgi:hypothetical protein